LVVEKALQHLVNDDIRLLAFDEGPVPGVMADVKDQRYTYTWAADPAATWYELYMDKNGALLFDQWYRLAELVVDSVTGNLAVDVLGNGSGSYQWWVRGWSPDGYGPWNDIGLPFLIP
jgi:hypothetical protein